MSRYRIMVVDDDSDIRFVTTGLLGGSFETVQAENGLDALEKIDRYEPDLMLVDIAMPVMDGFATCRSVRRHDGFSEMPVFFLTGYSSDEARRKAEEAGCHAYFEKPFDTAELVDRIQAFFDTHHQPPREKLFSLDEIERIDATPLRTLEVGEDDLLDEEEPPHAQGPFADTQAPGITPAPAGDETGEGTEATGKRGGITHKRHRKTLGATTRPEPAEPAPVEEAPPIHPAAPAPGVGSLLDKLKGLQREEPKEPESPVIPEHLRQTRQIPRPAPQEEEELHPTKLVEKPRIEEKPAAPPAEIHRRSALDSLRELEEQEEAERRRREAERRERLERPTQALKSPLVRPRTPAPDDESPLQPPSARPAPLEAAPPPPRPAVPPAVSAPPAAPRPPVAPPPARPAPSPGVAPAASSPALPPAPVRPHRPIPGAAKRPGASAPKVRPRVLCLIDNKADLLAYTEALKGLGEFLPLEDPVEAVAIIARFQPDIVVMHIAGNGYSGLQIAQMLQGNPRLSHVEVIFNFSGRETPAQVKAAERLSPNGQLRSPVTLDTARDSLRKVIAKPGFKVRQKKLGYGVYVDEVLRTIQDRKEEQRKEKEREFFEEKHEELVAGIKMAMKQVRPELQVGERSRKDLQAYYLEA